MPRFVSRRSHKAGLAPGALVPVEVPEVEDVEISVMDYDPGDVREARPASAAECEEYLDPSRVSWINVTGLHRTEVIEGFGELFRLHPLVLEDILNTEQRPKLDDYDDYLFLVARMLTFDVPRHRVEEEQVSLVLGEGHVLSFQERPGDVFDPLRGRIRSGKGRIRRMGADYLAYALADALVDHHFVVLEGMGDWMEEVEEELLEDPTQDTMHRINRVKKEGLVLRRSAWPLREVMSQLSRVEHPLVSDEVRIFARDAYDHTVQVLDMVETLRELASGMHDIYLSSLSNRMNEVMKVLTVMASIFIPLTFVAGVYGMNFEWMPELGWKWAYPAVLAAMALIAGGMVAYFRRRDWI